MGVRAQKRQRRVRFADQDGRKDYIDSESSDSSFDNAPIASTRTFTTTAASTSVRTLERADFQAVSERLADLVQERRYIMASYEQLARGRMSECRKILIDNSLLRQAVVEGYEDDRIQTWLETRRSRLEKEIQTEYRHPRKDQEEAAPNRQGFKPRREGLVDLRKNVEEELAAMALNSNGRKGQAHSHTQTDHKGEEDARSKPKARAPRKLRKTMTGKGQHDNNAAPVIGQNGLDGKKVPQNVRQARSLSEEADSYALSTRRSASPRRESGSTAPYEFRYRRRYWQ